MNRYIFISKCLEIAIADFHGLEHGSVRVSRAFLFERDTWDVGRTQKTVVCDFQAFRKNRTGEGYIKFFHFPRNG